MGRLSFHSPFIYIFLDLSFEISTENMTKLNPKYHKTYRKLLLDPKKRQGHSISQIAFFHCLPFSLTYFSCTVPLLRKGPG